MDGSSEDSGDEDMTGAGMSWHNGELFIIRNFCELFLCTGEQAAFFISNIIIIWAFLRSWGGAVKLGTGSRRISMSGQILTSISAQQLSSPQVSRISALLLIFKTILPDHLFLLWPREVWRKETRNIILKSSMKTNLNTQMCCAVLRLVTRNCCQHCRLCFDNVAGLSSCAGCCVSLFSSRSWAPMITNCLEWLPSSLCYPHIPRLTAPRPATIKHDITRTCIVLYFNLLIN